MIYNVAANRPRPANSPLTSSFQKRFEEPALPQEAHSPLESVYLESLRAQGEDLGGGLHRQQDASGVTLTADNGVSLHTSVIRRQVRSADGTILTTPDRTLSLPDGTTIRQQGLEWTSEDPEGNSLPVKFDPDQQLVACRDAETGRTRFVSLENLSTGVFDENHQSMSLISAENRELEFHKHGGLVDFCSPDGEIYGSSGPYGTYASSFGLQAYLPPRLPQPGDQYQGWLFV
ncbi:MAG: hypothetical protein U0931_20975 [Vulcanimicrobiota bacterium]